MKIVYFINKRYIEKKGGRKMEKFKLDGEEISYQLSKQAIHIPLQQL